MAILYIISFFFFFFFPFVIKATFLFSYLFAISSETKNLTVADVREDCGDDGSDTENTTPVSSPSWERNDINPPDLPEKLYPKPDHVSTPYEYFLKLFSPRSYRPHCLSNKFVCETK